MTADEIITHLNLAPHPEGGWYRQTWVDDADGRASGTSIYFLQRAAQSSHWHRIDAAEIWYYYAGAPLILSLSETDTGPAIEHTQGPDLAAGAYPQLTVLPYWWQAARTTGAWTLVGCTVSPGFQFEGFELAPPGFDIPRSAAC